MQRTSIQQPDLLHPPKDADAGIQLDPSQRDTAGCRDAEIPEWQQRQQEQMAAFVARKAAQKAERAQMKRGRDWWLPRRHAARLAANRTES
jgi:hypothetical protein